MPVMDGGLALYRDLEQRLPGLLKPRRAEMPMEAGVDIPSMPDLAPGSYEVVKTVINDVGNATILADGAFDFPVVDASASEDRYRVLMCVAAFTVGFQSQRQEAYASANNTLRARQYDVKMQTCVRAIQEKRDRVAAFGDSALGIGGMLNAPGVVPDNNSFNPYTATADQLSAFLLGLFRDFDTGSSSVFIPTTALVPTALDYRMITLVMPGTATTVKDHVEKALSAEGRKFEFRKRRYCDSKHLEANKVQAAGTNKDRIMLYTLDPEVLERHIELIQLAPPDYQQVKGLDRLYPMFGCTTPTIFNYTNAVQYTDVVKG